MNRAPQVIAVTTAYLSFAGLAMYAWLARAGSPLPAYVPLLCALPTALTLLVTVLSRPSPRERIVRSLACFLFFPILLLMWGTSADFSAPSAPREDGASERLRAQEILAGAIARQDLPGNRGVGFASEGATFPDGSELRLMHFQSAQDASNYLALLRGTLGARDLTIDGRRGAAAEVGPDLLVYWELHGPTLLELRAGNEQLVLARLRAQRVPPPSRTDVPAPRASLSARVAPDATAAPAWPFVLGYALAHVLFFLLFVYWTAAASTRVRAAHDEAPVSPALLLARFEALPGLGARCSVAQGASERERIIDLQTEGDAQRAHRLIVRVEAGQRCVRVLEREGAYWATPRDDDERSMRAPGEARFDPTRPMARRIASKKAQTTFIEAERLAALPLTFEHGLPRLPEAAAKALDADGIIHLVCAVVTRSGFDYQPVLFAFQSAGSTKP